MDTSVSIDQLPPSENQSCPNCDAAMTGTYCGSCGQKRIDHNEFALRHFFGHLVHEITHLDSNKIFRTLAHLLLRPGLLAREYLNGRKGKYINPIRVYLTVSAIYFLFAWGALSNAGGGGVQDTASRSAFVAIAKRKNVDPLVLAEKTQEKTAKISAFLRFASVLVSGLFLSLFYFRTGKYYVEHLVFSLYFYSFDFLAKCIVAVFYLTSAYTGTQLFVGIRILFYVVLFIYLLFALRRVYSEPWTKTILKSLALFVLEVGLFIAVNILGSVIAVSLI